MTLQKAAEEMETDLRSRVVALEQQSQAREQRLVLVENWQRQQEVAEARRDEKWQHLDVRLNSLDAKINKIGDTLTVVNRMIIAGLIAGVIAFIFGGGMALP
jgi:hypothetical protein